MGRVIGDHSKTTVTEITTGYNMQGLQNRKCMSACLTLKLCKHMHTCMCVYKYIYIHCMYTHIK